MNIFGKEISAAIFDMDGTMFDTRASANDYAQTGISGFIWASMSDELLINSLGLSAVRAEHLAKQESTVMIIHMPR